MSTSPIRVVQASSLRALLLSIALFATSPPTASAQRGVEAARALFQQRFAMVEIAAGERHLELGLWARGKGYVGPTRTEIQLAVDVSRRRLSRANTLATTMTQLGLEFWKKPVELTASRRKGYEKKRTRVWKENGAERYELAEWALEKELTDEARQAFAGLLDPAVPIELDEERRIETSAGPIPAPSSAAILGEAIEINGRPHLRDRFLERLPELPAVFEVSSGLLRVRIPSSLEDARAFHALGAALVPHLEAELGLPFLRRPSLFLFPTRKQYESYVVAAKLESYRSVSAFADVWTFTTLVCTEGKPAEHVQSLVLHELTHLADHDAFPQAMPPFTWLRTAKRRLGPWLPATRRSRR